MMQTFIDHNQKKSINSKNPMFGPFFPIFLILGAKVLFSKNPALLRTTTQHHIRLFLVSEENNEPISRKIWVEGQTDLN